MIARIQKYHIFFKKHKMQFEFPRIKQTLDKKKLIKMLPNYDGWIAGDDEKNFQLGKNYPLPLVKHETAREKALRAFKKI